MRRQMAGDKEGYGESQVSACGAVWQTCSLCLGGQTYLPLTQKTDGKRLWGAC